MGLIAAQIVTWEDSSVILMARIEDIEKALITIASVDTITLAVSATDGSGTPTGPNVVVADQVFDTPELNAKWTKDAIGYNFIHTLLPADIPDGDKTYRAEFEFTDTVGIVSQIVFEIDAKDLIRS